MPKVLFIASKMRTFFLTDWKNRWGYFEGAHLSDTGYDRVGERTRVYKSGILWSTVYEEDRAREVHDWHMKSLARREAEQKAAKKKSTEFMNSAKKHMDDRSEGEDWKE